MSLKEVTLKWEMFSENVWKNFGLIIKESHNVWHNENSSWDDKEIARFFAWTVPAILNTAEKMNWEKYSAIGDKRFFIKEVEKQDDGFYSSSTRPDHVDVNEELVAFFRGLSGKEKFNMLQRILTKKADAEDFSVDIHVQEVVQDMYASFILENSLRK